MKPLLCLILALLCISLTSCDEESDAKLVLPSISAYFPGAVLYKFDKRVLWIQTHVDGIGDKAALAIYAESCQQAEQMADGKISLKGVHVTITEEMNFDRHSFLIIGFKQGIVAWAVRDGVDANGTPRCVLLNWAQAGAWLQEHLGYKPTADKIQVVTLEAAREAHKGEPMQLETLAQVRGELKEHRDEQIKDLMLKESLLQSP